MSTTSTLQQPVSRDRPRSAISIVLQAGLRAGAVALVVVLAYALIIRAAGVPMKAGLPGAKTAQSVTLASFAVGIVLAAFWGTVIAALLSRYARKPRRTFTVVAVTATAISLITPLAAVGAAAETKVTLALAHILAASTMIPLLARGIGTTGRRRAS